ncbi:MAG: GNAT family N-acetyltransferase [Verrucomicrobia bacterium]|nr:GNAT family N-acetyltransferase [Verrucomicrobiota bacterium]
MSPSAPIPGTRAPDAHEEILPEGRNSWQGLGGASLCRGDSRIWDDFVLQHAEPHAEQLCAWGRLRQGEGWDPWRLELRDSGRRILGGAQILERRVGPGVKIGYVARGPLVAEGFERQDLVAEALAQVARRRRLSYLAVSLPYLAAGAVPSLEQAGFLRRPDTLPPSIGVKATMVLDLGPEEERLFGGFRKSRRNEIRRGERAGTTVRPGEARDLEPFETLVEALCARRGVRSNMPGHHFAAKLWSELHPSGLAQLFVAECRGELTSALMVLTGGAWARAWRIGWSGAHANAFPTQVLFWEAIRWSRQKGYRHFEMVGFDLRDATELAAGRPAEAPYHCQVSYFKAGWGGRVLLLPGEFCYFPQPWIRAALKIGGRRVLESRLLGRFLEALHAHKSRR